MRRIHPIASLVVSLGLLMVAAPAWAGDTFFVNSATGNDANTCTAAGQACLTIAHATELITAQTNPQNSTLKLSGTFNETIGFDAGDVDSDQTLDGLRITATDPDNKPTIDASGHSYGVRVTKINNLTIDHLIVSGSRVGISVAGYSNNYVNNTSIHHNTVTALTANPDFTGIELSIAKQATIEHNRINDITVTITDASGYTNSELIYVYLVRNSAVRNNTIRDVNVTNNSFASVSSRTTYLYGISGSVLTNVVIKENTVTGLSVTENSSLANVSHSNLVSGLYVNAATGIKVAKNELNTISAAGSARGIDGVNVTNQAYGVYLADIRAGADMNTITGNTIQEVTATQDTDAGAAYSYGMRLEYLYNALLKNNTIKNLTATGTGTLDSGNYTAYTYGVYGPYFGNNVELTNNTVRNLGATTNYTGDDSYSYPSVRAIYTHAAAVDVNQNTVRDLTWTVEQNGANRGNDYPHLSGIEVAYQDNINISNNTIRDLGGLYVATGEEAYVSPTLYGIYANTTSGAVINNNTVRAIELDYTLADVTNSSYSYQYVQPLYVRASTAVTVKNNTLKNITLTADGGAANPMYLYFYGYYLAHSDGTVDHNKLTNLTIENIATTGATTNNIYGIHLSGLGETVIHNNTLKQWTISSTSSAATQYVEGIFVAGGKPVYVNANTVRNLTVDSIANQEVIGINVYTDLSSGRIFNNIILGKAGYNNSGNYIGLYLPSDSTTDVDVVNNTFANWRYPVQIDGGNKVQLLNNIMSATTNSGYALAVKYDHLNLDNFKSDYNLMYTTQGKTDTVYDLDNSEAIHFGDWTNTRATYGYDLHSRYHKAGLKSSGLLRSSSVAIDHGSDNFNYTANDLAYALIHTDVNGTARPGGDGKVDIGADQRP